METILTLDKGNEKKRREVQLHLEESSQDV